MSVSLPRKRVSIYGERHVPESLPVVAGLTFGRLLGEGHFSHVYLGNYKNGRVAVKVIERGSPSLISTEIDILTRLRGVPNVVQLLDVVHADQTLLIFEYLRTIDVETFLDDLTLPLFRIYLRALLQGLAGAHARGVLHLDVKPGNVAVSPHWRTIKLIDWGCGALIGSEINVRGGSKLCHPPEMTLGFPHCGAGCDIWATGVLIIYVLSDRRVPWAGRTNRDMLIRMSEYFGAGEIRAVARRLEIEIDPEVDAALLAEPTRRIESVVTEDFADLADPELLDLAKLLLTIDPERRPSAEQALQHRFFQATN
jgi:serine/threonine protein kinase